MVRGAVVCGRRMLQMQPATCKQRGNEHPDFSPSASCRALPPVGQTEPQAEGQGARLLSLSRDEALPPRAKRSAGEGGRPDLQGQDILHICVCGMLFVIAV